MISIKKPYSQNISCQSSPKAIDCINIDSYLNVTNQEYSIGLRSERRGESRGCLFVVGLFFLLVIVLTQ